MGLQAILDTIRSSGAAQVKEIETFAYQQAQEILENARLEAQQIQESACLAASQPAYRECARILHKAHLEAIQIAGKEREALVDTTIERTKLQLLDIRADPTYLGIFYRLTQEAMEELKGSLGGEEQAVIIADPRDHELVEKVLIDLKLSLPVRYELNCWGGLMVKSEDHQVAVINTLEARLERALPFLRRDLAARFEEEHGKNEVCQLTIMEMPGSGL